MLRNISDLKLIALFSLSNFFDSCLVQKCVNSFGSSLDLKVAEER